MKLTALLAAGAIMAPLPSLAYNTPGQNALFGLIGGNVYCALVRAGYTGDALHQELRTLGSKVKYDLEITDFDELDQRQVGEAYEHALKSCPPVAIPDA